jgi:SAM-dependent methyltransferase
MMRTMSTLSRPGFLTHEITRGRYETLRAGLETLREHIEGRRVLDFGCGFGMSLHALIEVGAREAVGVEPVEKWVRDYAHTFYGQPIEMHHVPDTRALPFDDAEFDTVIANAVFEHIPQPRDAYIAEAWRVLRPGGVLIINETPNKYWPKEDHTTGLWFNHWLPRGVAYRRAIRRGRFDPTRDDWASSGWRGMSYFEMVRAIDNYELVPETSRLRHRLFSALGIPASIIDPYPLWLLRKR